VLQIVVLSQNNYDAAIFYPQKCCFCLKLFNFCGFIASRYGSSTSLSIFISNSSSFARQVV